MIVERSSPSTALHRLPPPSTARYFGIPMTHAARPQPPSLYPTRAAAGVLLGLTPDGVEVASHTARATGAQFDVMVADFIRLGSSAVPIGAVAESAPTEMDPDFQPTMALLDELTAAIDEARARISRDIMLYRTQRPVKKLVGKVAVIVDGHVVHPWKALAAAKAAEELGANQVVIATPVASEAAADRVRARRYGP